MFGWLRNQFAHKISTEIKKPDWVNEFFDEAELERLFTPDLPQLERNEWHWYFSCDETQTGHWREHLLSGCERREEVAFSQDHLMMLKKDIGLFTEPLIFKSQMDYKNPPPKLPVKGELVKIPPRQFLLLDKEKQNTVSSFRNLVPIVIPYEQLFFKDRSLLSSLSKTTKKGASVQTSYMARTGVWRVWAWMYFADASYWGDLLNLNTGTPPVKTYHIKNEKSLINRYYRFTSSEYGTNNNNTEDVPF